MINAFSTAFRTLTCIPIPGRESRNFPASLIFFPAVGGALGLVVLCFYYAAIQCDIKEWDLTALVLLMVVTVLTGALHVDGLADTFDALGGGKTRERFLAILKDPHLGTFGVTALVFDLLIKFFFWRYFMEAGWPAIILCSLIFARCAQAGLLLVGTPAQPDSVLSVFVKPRLWVSITTMVVWMGIVGATGLVMNWTFALLFFMTTTAIAGVAGKAFCIKAGGISGDCVGAVNELVELGILVAGFLVLKIF